MGERRSRPGGELTGRPAEYPDGLAALFDRGRSDPLFVRVLLWEALESTDPDDTSEADTGVRRAIYEERIAWVRGEQAVGHLPTALDPGLLYLSLVGASVYPLLLPRVCELVTGEAPDTEEFAARYRAHLVVLTELLGV